MWREFWGSKDGFITPPNLHRASLTENAVKLVNLREGISVPRVPSPLGEIPVGGEGATSARLFVFACRWTHYEPLRRIRLA